mmetsp:Transcript_2663/g.3600  ORF Transcript_2663/g.3600 Transcript_2663/m.3600 type:complete len:207 (-) Transcript_2663:85-705(-)
MFEDAKAVNDILFAPDGTTAYLLLSGHWATLDYECLQNLGITHIVNAHHTLDNPFPNDFVYCKIELEDVASENIMQYFDKVSNFIADAVVDSRVGNVESPSGKNRVLVHCRAGVSRSATFVMAYMMREEKMTLKEAFYHVLDRREVIYPNPGFILQLSSYEKKLTGKSTLKHIPEYSHVWSNDPSYKNALKDVFDGEKKSKNCTLQ